MSGAPSATSIALPPDRRHRRVEECMGTVFSIDVRLPGCAATVVEDAVRWLHWVDETFSTYRAGSEISRLGRGELTLDRCAPEVAEVLGACAELERETDGFFSSRPGGILDPSGFVKGWALQGVNQRLLDAGSTNHCVNGGGDVQCAGRPDPQSPWRIGIADPFDRARLITAVAGIGLAVATSGSAERGAHIVDPHSGRSPDALVSVTLIGRQIARTDALATAAFAMGAGAPEWIAGRPDLEGIVVFGDGRVWFSAGLDRSRE